MTTERTARTENWENRYCGNRHFPPIVLRLLSCDEPDPGLLQTLGFCRPWASADLGLSKGFANAWATYKYTSAVSGASVGLATV